MEHFTYGWQKQARIGFCRTFLKATGRLLSLSQRDGSYWSTPLTGLLIQTPGSCPHRSHLCVFFHFLILSLHLFPTTPIHSHLSFLLSKYFLPLTPVSINRAPDHHRLLPKLRQQPHNWSPHCQTCPINFPHNSQCDLILLYSLPHPYTPMVASPSPIASKFSLLSGNMLFPLSGTPLFLIFMYLEASPPSRLSLNFTSLERFSLTKQFSFTLSLLLFSLFF